MERNVRVWTVHWNFKEGIVVSYKGVGELKPEPVQWPKPVILLHLHCHSIKIRTRNCPESHKGERENEETVVELLYGTNRTIRVLLLLSGHLVWVGSTWRNRFTSDPRG